ncbi:MAG: virulence RhuM family protein [Anaeroplasmataceae bacterium]|nr:virulence RhuM family protein [Anaeroplasmataceae bacterium]
MKANEYELIKFEDGEFSLDVNVSPTEDTVWLNRLEIAKLFDRDVKTIGKHINNALNEEAENATVANFETVQMEGNRKIKRIIQYYNLDIILSVGYRVKSKRGISGLPLFLNNI